MKQSGWPSPATALRQPLPLNSATQSRTLRFRFIAYPNRAQPTFAISNRKPDGTLAGFFYKTDHLYGFHDKGEPESELTPTYADARAAGYNPSTSNKSICASN